MMLVPVPGGVAGDLTPNGNLGAYVDRRIFGAHLWVQSKTWDPEGLLSTVPALATTLLGCVAGLWLGSRASGPRKALWMVVAGDRGDGHRARLEPGVSAQQGAVDQFVRLVHGRRARRYSWRCVMR